MIYPGAGNVVQSCFAVDDIDVAMQHWQAALGAGPFHVFRAVELEVIHRGVPRPLRLSIGLAQVGATHVELIQQLGDDPSVYRDAFPEGGGGFHHVAVLVPDVDAARRFYEERGIEIAMSLTFGRTPVIYADTRRELGCMTEVLRDDDAIVELYAHVAATAAGWDGTDPVRDLPT